MLSEFNHPVGIVTKSALVLRDLDILTSMAERGLVKVAISVTTLDGKLARAMEPRASTPAKRLEALRVLSAAGIPTVVMIGPVIPAVNDMEIEAILKAAAVAGVKEAGYTMLRLPLEVKDIFKEWLMTEMPDRASKVMALVKSVRNGKENDATFGRRMTRHRALCLDHRAALSTGGRTPRHQCEADDACHRPVPKAAAGGRAVDADLGVMTAPSICHPDE